MYHPTEKELLDLGFTKINQSFKFNENLIYFPTRCAVEQGCVWVGGYFSYFKGEEKCPVCFYPRDFAELKEFVDNFDAIINPKLITS